MLKQISRNFTLLLGLTLSFIVLSSCQSKPKQQYFPLKKGNVWNYTVRTGLQTKVQTLTVEKPIAICSARGWHLTGPMGESRVVWKNGVLFVEQLPDTLFSPPLPLLSAIQIQSKRVWKGQVYYMGKNLDALAEIEQGPDQYIIGGQSFSVVKVLMNLQLPQKKIELTTWFSEGIGILSQQQRSQGYLDCSLEYLSGP